MIYKGPYFNWTVQKSIIIGITKYKKGKFCSNWETLTVKETRDDAGGDERADVILVTARKRPNDGNELQFEDIIAVFLCQQLD